MSLYLALGIVLAVSIFLRFRYGSDVMPYAAGALLLALFLYCPTRFNSGMQAWSRASPPSLEEKVDLLGDVVSFGLLATGAWIVGSGNRKRTP